MLANGPLLDELGGKLVALTQPTVLIELAAALAALVLAWVFVAALRRLSGQRNPDSILFGRHLFDGALFPLVLLVFGYVARNFVDDHIPLAAFRLVIPALMSLAVIRTGAKVLQAAFPQAQWLGDIERTISWLVWGAMVLWVTGVLPRVLVALGQVRWKMGSSEMSVRTVLEGAITAGIVLLAALWISSVLEARLLRSATGSGLSVRKALSNAIRALLLFVGLMFALSAAGIDLTALSVLGGAVGVGIGLGLQKLAANYVSGFVILAERSVRIGDNVRVDGFEGRITDITGRYTVIRSPGGRESIVPNEMLISQRVENLSLADPRVWQSTVVSVGYDSDVDLVMRLLCEAAYASPRVLKEPGPSAALSAFGADGLEFTLGFWIVDPENGTLSLRSDINLAILRALRAHGIDIPFPQRVVQIQGFGPAAQAAGGAMVPNVPADLAQTPASAL
ncbi:MAG: mechanosensitive ion channel [Giesbergeria sp.]|jgi:small-conductance mechanosensitive channel|nr:mechanosensitive ion channel [Giesbergeria sp.]MBP6158882.1 mechanosensitive ion channel [Giesbergeria sp.]MBP7083812.1 mechanosensitive ion channel [Giesbergeria sp.]MBP9784492.1 mechanosensitive ion channel [Giesbergeria sp.]MBP9895003.1 mechanosensitive ion channel [Giesbergeria sp.]